MALYIERDQCGSDETSMSRLYGVDERSIWGR